MKPYRLFAVPVEKDNPLYSAKLKVQRAEHYISNLKRTISRFIEQHAHATYASARTEAGEGMLTVTLGKELPPRTIPLVVADAIHNLRTALDHANWELRGLDGGAQNRYTSLPIRDTRADYESLCDTIKTPTGDLPNFFKSLEFFKDGAGHLIWALHD